MNNTILALDILSGALNVMIQAQAMLERAAREGRDITDDELRALRVASADKASKLLES